MEVRTRFAPSPTGYMHIGNLRTALYEYLIAKSQGGKFILRIEDTDQGRLVEGSLDVIYKTMKMTGLQHDEVPMSAANTAPMCRANAWVCIWIMQRNWWKRAKRITASAPRKDWKA